MNIYSETECQLCNKNNRISKKIPCLFYITMGIILLNNRKYPLIEKLIILFLHIKVSTRDLTTKQKTKICKEMNTLVNVSHFFSRNKICE